VNTKGNAAALINGGENSALTPLLEIKRHLKIADTPDAVVFELEEPVGIVERLLSPRRDDWLYAGKYHPADMALSVDLVHEAGPQAV
jgi:hypothetical protein